MKIANVFVFLFGYPYIDENICTMAPIFDFKKWLTYIDNDEPAELVELFTVVRTCENGSIFNCKQLDEEKYLITCSYIDEKLLITSEKQLNYFLSYLENTYAGGDVEANEALHRANQD
jgi:hypothetical protein